MLTPNISENKDNSKKLDLFSILSSPVFGAGLGIASSFVNSVNQRKLQEKYDRITYDQRQKQVALAGYGPKRLDIYGGIANG